MSLIVEDGTGMSNSESYCSVAFATTYWSNRNDTVWAALTTAAQEAALRIATTFMIELYRMRWKGRRVLISQALDWPRVGVVLEDFGGSQGRHGFGSYGLFQVSYTIVPNELQAACAEMAYRAMGSSSALATDLEQMVLSEKVGPIEVEYNKDSPQYTRYRSIDMLLKPYLMDGGSQGVQVSLGRT